MKNTKTPGFCFVMRFSVYKLSLVNIFYAMLKPYTFWNLKFIRQWGKAIAYIKWLVSNLCTRKKFQPETRDHYLLRCKLYTDLRLDLLNDIYIYIYNIYTIFKRLVNVLQFGSENFKLHANANILRRTIEFLKATKRFSSLLF